MVEIPLRDRTGAVVAHALLDDADVALSAHRWYVHRSDTRPYAARKVTQDGKRSRLFMHRVVLGLDVGDGQTSDHINGDTLDNRRSNLRIVTTAQNAQNQGSRGGSSQFRGVTWDKSRGKWLASAQLDGRRVTIGRFDSERDAGEAVAGWRRQHMAFSQEAAA